MLRSVGRIGLCLMVTILGAGPSVASKTHFHHRQRHAGRAHAPLRQLQARSPSAYGTNLSPTPDCRYPDGTPFDPDIIGGPNHVGDGGPAVNLGGFPPCGY